MLKKFDNVQEMLETGVMLDASDAIETCDGEFTSEDAVKALSSILKDDLGYVDRDTYDEQDYTLMSEKIDALNYLTSDGVGKRWKRASSMEVIEVEG